MNCKIDGCNRDIMYKKQKVCQKHYFRFMRYGTYDLTSVRKIRTENPAGYQRIYEPKHKLANKDGYVYEHRKVFFDSGKDASSCSLCSKDITWKNLHIDHIDNNVRNNDITNLRPTCRGCNTFRGHSSTSMGKLLLTHNGKTLTCHGWARQDGVIVTGHTIMRRFKDGYSAEDAIYGERKTHHNTKSKKPNVMHDEVRGIR